MCVSQETAFPSVRYCVPPRNLLVACSAGPYQPSSTHGHMSKVFRHIEVRTKTIVFLNKKSSTTYCGASISDLKWSIVNPSDNIHAQIISALGIDSIQGFRW